MSEIRILLPVFGDVADAASWYDEEGYVGLGDRFASVFYSRLADVHQYGTAYAKVYGDFHRVLLNPFPYAMYYRYHRDWIVIALVIHTARSPRLMKQLLRERLKESHDD
jgi:hypothetical protein